MSKQEESLCRVFGSCRKISGLAALTAAAVLVLGNGASGQLMAPTLDMGPGIGIGIRDNGGGTKGEAGADRAIRLLTLAPVPKTAANNTAGAMYSFDISFVDQETQTYYLADRSNVVVDVVDAKTGKFTKQIPASPPFKGFTGSNDTSGPNGVVAAFPWLFVTDGGSRVITIDLRTDATVSDVTTSAGDPKRADELAYDPDHGLLLVINNADTPPFGTLISVNKSTGKLTVGSRITFDAAHGVDATNGAEQPVWEPSTNRFYLSIPQIGSNKKDGGVVRINPFSATVEATYPVQYCGPAGLTLGPKQDLFIGCNTVFDTAGNVWNPDGTVPADPRDVIIDAKTGNIDAVVFGVGAGDEVWFNRGDGNYYATGSGSPQRPLEVPQPTPPAVNNAKGSTPAGVVDAKDQRLLGLFPTYNVPAVTGTGAHPAGTSHSIAANARNNLVFVPLPANNAFLSPDAKYDCLTGCVAVFTHADEDK
jgi:hypothetical protein